MNSNIKDIVKADSSVSAIILARLFSSSALLGVGLSLVFLFLCLKFPKRVIVGSYISLAMLLLGLGVYACINGEFRGGAILIISALIDFLFLYFSRDRIEFSSLMLSTVVSVFKKYHSMIYVQFYLVFFSIAYTVGITIAVLELGRIKWLNPATSILVILSFFWTFQVLGNTNHVTISGVYASHYFLHNTGKDNRNPTMRSFRRAVTYSFGSICYGSLLIAIIQTARYILNSAKNQKGDKSAVLIFLAVCAECLLSIIEDLAKHFNRYAFAHVAIYGKPFYTSAKDTWDLMMSHGISLLISDILIDSVLAISYLICLALSSVVYVMSSSKTGYFGEFSYAHVIAIMFTTFIFSVVAKIIQSGVIATAVCLATDPEAIKTSQPDFYNQITVRYPEFSPIGEARQE